VLRSCVTLSVLVLYAAVVPGAEQDQVPSPDIVVTPRPEELQAFLVEYQKDSFAPLIEHCIDAAPALREPLSREYSRVSRYFPKVSKAVLRRIGISTKSSAYFSPEARAELQRAKGVMRQRTVSLDPDTFCPSLLERLRKTTPRVLMDVLERAFGTPETPVQKKNMDPR
jgi:hypothetical protein